MLRKSNFLAALVIICTSFVVNGGCMTTPTYPEPYQLTAPTPIPSNTGRFMCPYTQDGVVALWCDKAINVSVGATVGSTVGAYAGSKALEQIPFIGGFIGSEVGKAAGRAIAVESIGGWDYVKQTSDQSFDNMDDMCVWMYATKSGNEHYQDVFKAMCQVYPEFKTRYSAAILTSGKIGSKR